MLRYKVILFLLFNFDVIYCEDNNVIVETNSGLVKGVKVESDISDFIAFFSIPYAEPPVGERRFKLPETVKPWSTIRDATTEGPICVQKNATVETSEDCLTLSVYTTNTTGLKPVFVYVHGGALESGSARMSLYGPDYFMKHDIVVVVIQFRLAIFGYLNLGLEEAPGNMGLADTIEATKWVKSNIQYFGGNPDDITIGGLSSGAIMVHALLTSPKSQSLFQKIIIHSGTSLSYRFFIQNNEEPLNKLKQVLNMTDANNKQVLDQLMKLDPSELLSVTSTIQSAYPKGYASYYPFCMTKDFNGIIPENPIQMLRRFNYLQIPMLIGRTSTEGIRLESQLSRINFVNDNVEIIVPTDLFPVDEKSLAKRTVAEVIKEFYFQNSSISEETFYKFAEMCTDSWYGHITDYVIRLQESLGYAADIYYYMFSVDGAFNYGKIKENITSVGVTHSDDIGYTWKVTETPNISAIVPNDDYSEISRERYVALLANFIKYGDPTPETSTLLPIKWKPVNYPEMNYLNINSTLTMEQDLHRDRLLFWQRLYGYQEL